MERRDYRKPDRHQRTNDALAAFFLLVILVGLLVGMYLLVHHLDPEAL